MRKLLSLILIVVLLLCLSACTTYRDMKAVEDELLVALQETQYLLTQYENLLNAPEPEAPVEFHWNMKTALWVVMPESPTAGNIIIADAVGSMCEACGWTYEKKELDGEPGSERNILTAAMADGGVGAIVFMTIEDHISGVLREAALEGIMVFSAEPTAENLAGSVDVSEAVLAQETAALAEAWADTFSKRTGNKETLSVAITAQGCETESERQWSTEMEDALFSCSGLTYGVTAMLVQGDTFTRAYEWARTVIADNENMRIFCCRMPQAAYGVCCYLEQYCADEGLDLADYCVVWVGQDEESNAYISAAAENASVTAAKGCLLYGDSSWKTGARLGTELLGIAYGENLPEETELSDVWALLSENGIDMPDELISWQWGTNAVVCTDSYASFGDYTGTLFRHTDLTAPELPEQ